MSRPSRAPRRRSRERPRAAELSQFGKRTASRKNRICFNFSTFNGASAPFLAGIEVEPPRHPSEDHALTNAARRIRVTKLSQNRAASQADLISDGRLPAGAKLPARMSESTRSAAAGYPPGKLMRRI